jgi:hypothetical protein
MLSGMLLFPRGRVMSRESVTGHGAHVVRVIKVMVLLGGSALSALSAHLVEDGHQHGHEAQPARHKPHTYLITSLNAATKPSHSRKKR